VTTQPTLTIRLSHVRSFQDTGPIQIRPITILVGRNNSGKSSLTRFFPLLKQSIQARSNAPLLWFGPFVDFGSFEEVKSSFAEDGTIVISFTVPVTPFMHLYLMSRDLPALFRNIPEISYTLYLRAHEERTVICKLQLDISSDIVSIDINDDGLVRRASVNDSDVTAYFDENQVLMQTNHLVPQFLILDSPSRRRIFSPFGTSPLTTVDAKLSDLLRNVLHGNVLSATINRFIQGINYRPADTFISSLAASTYTHASWRSFVESAERGHLSRTIEEMRRLYLIRDLPALFGFLEYAFQQLGSGISYVGPARASSERYYRMQELAIEQIDPAGSNFAMFLNSLTTREQTDLRCGLQNL
jgi:hypothetical protein